MTICIICNKNFFTVWSKCNKCDGKIIYTDSNICFICKERRILPPKQFNGICNKCYSSSSINNSVCICLNDNNL